MKSISVFFISVFISIGSTYGSEEKEKEIGYECSEFVEQLIRDNYRTLFSIDTIYKDDILSDCRSSHELDRQNVVYLFGLAKSLDTYHLAGTVTLEHAVAFLRIAAKSGYEPAILQLLRYIRRDPQVQDPFLSKMRALQFWIDDDPAVFIDQLKSSKSMHVRDYVLGVIVYELPKRITLAKKIALENVAQGSRRAMLYLGMMHITGNGIEQNREKGVGYVRKSAELGDWEAQYMYAAIPGPAYGSDNEAYRYLSMAANSGHVMSLARIQVEIDVLTENILKVPQLEWFKTRFLRKALLNVISCSLEYDTKSKLLNRRKLPDCIN